jgi:hypothetical protein
MRRSLLFSCLLLKPKKNLVHGGNSSDAKVTQVKLLAMRCKAPSNGTKGSLTRVAAMLQLVTAFPAFETLIFLFSIYTTSLIYMRSSK